MDNKGVENELNEMDEVTISELDFRGVCWPQPSLRSDDPLLWANISTFIEAF